jgi:hypothetical protein
MPASNSLAAAAAKLVEGRELGPWPDEVYVQLLALTRQAAVSVAWSTMNYRCEACSFEWEVYLALGCEGPPELKEVGLAVAVPFVIECRAWVPDEDVPAETPPELAIKACEGHMQHVDWARDRTLSPPALIPEDAPRFVLPETGSGESFPCGRLEIPTPALVRARRSGSES